MNDPTVDVDTWAQRIDAARDRRDRWISLWAEYARLHTNAYMASKAVNDDPAVFLPNGDQVKLGLVHRNIEQTMALLEVPEVGVRVTAMDYRRELTQDDTHREGVVEAALVRSLKRSGLVKGTEEVDPIKRDGVIIGHGVCYSWWRRVEREVEVSRIQVLEADEAGVLQPVVDDAGNPVFEPLLEKRVIWHDVQDERVSPLEFLFDAQALSMVKSPWHAMDRVVRAADVKANPDLVVPDYLAPTSFTVRDLYGDTNPDQHQEDECYRQIVIWDKESSELITLLEGKDTRKGVSAKAPTKRKVKGKNSAKEHLCYAVAAVERWPLTFPLPDDSPFSFFIPIPANEFPWGISQIEHIRIPALEADKTRTRWANMVRRTRRIPWYLKGRVDADQIANAFNGNSDDPVGIDLRDGEKPDLLFGELPIPGVDADFYSAAKAAAAEIPLISGVPEAPFSGAGTATESENIMAVGGARPDRKRRKLLSFYTDVLRKHLAFRREFDAEGQQIVVMGPEGVPFNQTYGREAFQGDLEAEFLPGGEAMTLSPVRQKMLIEAGNLFLGRFSPRFDRIFARQLFTMLDMRDVNALLEAMPNSNAPYPAPLPGGGDGRARAPAFAIGDQSNGQAIRAAVNAASEGRIVQ